MDYVQFDLIRKIRAGLSTSTVGNKGTKSFRGDKGKAMRLSSCEADDEILS